MHSVRLKGVVFFAAVACGSAAQGATLIPVVPVPGSTITYIGGLNDENIITGSYVTSDGVTHGYFGTLDGQYQTFDYGAGDTHPLAISNDGYISGYASGVGERIYGYEFVRAPDGSITTIDNKRRHGTPLNGLAQGIVKNINFVGDYWDENFLTHGYVGKGAYLRAELTLPFDTDKVRPRGLNQDGTVVGYFRDLDQIDRDNFRGFILKDDVATAFDYPDPRANYVWPEASNKHGIIAGAWAANDGSVEEAFLFDTIKGKFRTITVPGALYPIARGINAAGIVALSSDIGGFIYCPGKSNCPVGDRKAIHMSNTWISAPPGSVQTAICNNRCVGPWGRSSAKANVTARREAMKRDPELQRELSLPFRP